MNLLVATHETVMRVDAEAGRMHPVGGLAGERPTCLAADPRVPGRAWCGTSGRGAFRSDDGGESWHAQGLAQQRLMSLAASPTEPDVVWAGTEPSELWRSEDGGESWAQTTPLSTLPSSGSWAFPPRPDTHHVRWIACHPHDPRRLWVAVEAGALISTADGGKSWRDRVPGGPYDTHELAIHPDAPETLRVAAGDGYYESYDGGESWALPRAGLEVGYLRSVAIDPGSRDVVLVSASSRPRTAYVAGSADGRLYRRAGAGAWERIVHGWPRDPSTIAPLLLAGGRAGELWAADERGVHHSDDAGVKWRLVVPFPERPNHLRALVAVTEP